MVADIGQAGPEGVMSTSAASLTAVLMRLYLKVTSRRHLAGNTSLVCLAFRCLLKLQILSTAKEDVC